MGSSVSSPPRSRIGESFEWNTDTPPPGALEENGAAVSRTTYAALFAKIGTTFGAGDGATTFNLPDRRRRTAIGKGGTGTGTIGNALGNTGGAETHTLTTAQMPSHSHSITAGSSSSGGAVTPSNNGSYGSSYTTAEGGGQSHNNMQPSIVKTFCIWYK